MELEVVKIGGADGNPLEPLCADLARAQAAGRRVVLVHGGSGETARLAAALGVEQEELVSPSGHVSRRTDRATLEVFAQATALVNRRLVELLGGLGVHATGISGLDGRTVQAKRKEAVRAVRDGRTLVVRDQWTGRPTGSDPMVLRVLLAAGTLPVVAPLGAGEQGEMLNVDGDRAAACIAAARAASRLTILSNVPGLLRTFPDEGSLVTRLGVNELDGFPPVSLGRMAKKLMAAREALDGGVGEVVIGDARRAQPLADAWSGRGTVITAAPAHAGAASPARAVRGAEHER